MQSTAPPPIVLYGPSQAPYTEKVRRALLLKQLPFELREPESQDDYQRWSPETGLLPALSIGEERVYDSTRILYRLDELFPEPPLLSPDPQIGEQQRQLEDWADESFLWYFSRWVKLQKSAELPNARAWIMAPRELIDREHRRAASLWRRTLAWLRAGGTWERPEDAILRGLSDRLDDLVNFLGARPFFFSERVSMADLAVYGMLCTMRTNVIPGAPRSLAVRPSLVEFMRRVEHATGGGESST
jgi:glutathione S-transferase